MNDRLPSFADRLTTTQGFLFLFTRGMRLSVPLLAMVALLLYDDIARSETHKPWIDQDLGKAFEAIGRAILVNQDNEDQIRTGAREKKLAGPSEVDQALVQIFDLGGRAPNPNNVVSLQPSNLPTASGSGTNLSRDGSCAVGYQDAGFFTPFHALRWTQATGPVDLGTLDSTNNASRSSSATDTNQDCSVVVGFSDVTAGSATQSRDRMFRRTGACRHVELRQQQRFPASGRQFERRSSQRHTGWNVDRDGDGIFGR